MKKLLATVVAVALSAALFTGCTFQGGESPSASTTPTPAPPTVKTIDHITFACGMDAITLDPQMINDQRSGEIIYYTFANLFRNYNNEVQNDLCESYEVSDDGKTYTFKLRDAVWADGEAVTAEHFRYAVERLLDPATGSSQADGYYYIKNAEAFNTGAITDAAELGVSAPDDKTFVMELEYAHPYLITALSVSTNTMPVRKDVIEKFGAAYGSSPETLVTNGAYTLKTWVAESEIVMEKSDTYWDKDNITVNKITRLTVADANTRMSMFDAGEVDGINETVAALADNYASAEASLSSTIRSIQINVNGKTEATTTLMQNRNFINALSYALDRTVLTNATISKFSQPYNRFAFPGFPGTAEGKLYVEEFPMQNLVPLTGDKDKANEYLDKALEELNLTRDTLPAVSLVTFESPNWKIIAEAYIDTWSQVLGISNIQLEQFPIPVAIQTCAERKYDLYLQSFSAGIDIYDYLKSWTSNGGVNWTGWADETFDKMVFDTNDILDPAARMAALAKAEQYFIDNGPQIPINLPGGYYLIRDGIKGYYNGNGASGYQQWLYCYEE